MVKPRYSFKNCHLLIFLLYQVTGGGRKQMNNSVLLNWLRQRAVEVETLASRIAGWTELPFVVMPTGTPVNIEAQNIIAVRLLERENFMRTFNTRDVVCQTETHGVGGLLQVGYMVLSEGYTDCLRHEFMHALGFDGHWLGRDRFDPVHSVLALRYTPTRRLRFTRFDAIAIRTLYHQRLWPGMPRRRALAVAERLYKDVSGI